MFIVLETQTNPDGTVGVIPTAYTDMQEATSKYYAILSVAATSQVPKHTAFLLTDDGQVIESRSFIHDTQKSEEE